MIDTLHPQDPTTWAQLHFAGASLGDVRRTRRVQAIAKAMAENPGQSVPQLFTHPYAVKASYTFFDREETTPERLQAGHREVVLERLKEEPGVYLLVEDGSEISFSGKKPVEGLGPIGSGKEGMQGFLLHSVLAMRWWGGEQAAPAKTGAKRPPVEVLGLAAQSYRVRKEVPAMAGGRRTPHRGSDEREKARIG